MQRFIFVDTDGTIKTCCSAEQVFVLRSNFETLRAVIGRCPSCLSNMLHLFCGFTCHSNQTLFMSDLKLGYIDADYAFDGQSDIDPQVDEIGNEEHEAGNVDQPLVEENEEDLIDAQSSGDTESPNLEYDDSLRRMKRQAEPKQIAYVEGVESVRVDRETMNQLFDSCINVQMAGTRALEIIVGSDPTIEKLLEYMGSRQKNERVPMDIGYQMVDNDPTALAYRAFACNETEPRTRMRCACADCPACCASFADEVFIPSNSCQFYNIDCYFFIALVACAIFAASILLFAFIYRIMCAKYRRNRRLPAEVIGSTNSLYGKDIAIIQAEPPTTTFMERFGAKFEHTLEMRFRDWGSFCARNPALVIIFSVSICAALSGGLAMNRKPLVDPVELWSAPDSRARVEKDYFDNHFGPFYRTSQIIFTMDNADFCDLTTIIHFNPNGSCLFQSANVKKMYEIYKKILAIEVEYDGGTVKFDDISLKPMYPQNNGSLSLNMFQYFQNDEEKLEEAFEWDYDLFLDHLWECMRNPANIGSIGDDTERHFCMGEFGGPVAPYLAFGGFKTEKYFTSSAIIFTFPVKNYVEEEKNGAALMWEKQFIEVMKNYSKEEHPFRISYRAERSIYDEIDRQSDTDKMTILLSYLIMFVYVTISLGQYQPHQLLHIIVHAKATLGLAGVMVVLLSVTAALGLYAYTGIPPTLIILEVVPFLVLAVGVDNIFILVQAYQRLPRNVDATVEERIGFVVGRLGPSMMLTSFSESIAFLLGALSNMPAVHIFSLYAGTAVLLNFFLQMTAFIAMLAYDGRRMAVSYQLHIRIHCISLFNSFLGLSTRHLLLRSYAIGR